MIHIIELKINVYFYIYIYSDCVHGRVHSRRVVNRYVWHWKKQQQQQKKQQQIPMSANVVSSRGQDDACAIIYTGRHAHTPTGCFLLLAIIAGLRSCVTKK